MKWTEQRLILAISTLLVCPAVSGINNDSDASERNYRVIVDRNPFGLKPPPPPPTNNPVLNQPKDEIFLTGITSIGTARAYFMNKAPQGKTPDYYSLGVDEKRNGLEILDIDPASKSVRVRNLGVESVMTFASNGVKPPPVAAAPPPAPPGTTPQMPGVVTMPGANPTAPGMVGPGAHGNPASPSGSGRIRTIPSRNVRTAPAMDARYGITPGAEVNQNVTRPDPNAPVQDVLMMELQKRANPNVIFPPTPLPQ